MTVSIERLEEIADEVISLVGSSDIFGFLSAASEEDLSVLERRLQEIMQSRTRFDTEELAMYLRTSYSRSSSLPTWQPLFNAAVEQGIMRQEQVEDIFYGMMPNRSRPPTNTGY